METMMISKTNRMLTISDKCAKTKRKSLIWWSVVEIIPLTVIPSLNSHLIKIRRFLIPVRT